MNQKNDKVIYLTFDDGPLDPYTLQILDIFGQFHAKATFFCCGKNIEKNSASFLRIVKAGHAIGNHTYSHSFGKTITGNVLTEVERTQLLIEHGTSAESRLYRSPWGITLFWLKTRLMSEEYVLCTWDIMAFDWLAPSPEFIARHIIGRAFPGAVVLLHDGNRTGPGNRESTVKSLPIILAALQEQGYEFRALDADHRNNPGFWKNVVVDIVLGIINK